MTESLPDRWTPDHITALREAGRPQRLALARQTPDQKVEQRVQMRASLALEQMERTERLWRMLAQTVTELRQAVEDFHESLAQQVRPLDDQHQHDQKNETRVHLEPPPADNRP